MSIIVPCYNQGKFLDECLNSVIGQSYANWECVIVNDGSSDNTEYLAKKWLLKDKRFTYIYQENQGLCSARNFGIEHSNGQLILPLDADDKIGKKLLSLAVKTFNKEPNLKLVYSNAFKFGEVNENWNLPDYSLKKLALQNMIFCSAFFKKEDWKRVGGYDINMIYGWEDWEFWINILKSGAGVKRLDYIGFFYRVKERSMINSITRKQQQWTLEYVNRKHLDLYMQEYGTYQEYTNQIIKERRIVENQFKSRRRILNQFLKLFFKLDFSNFLLKK